MVYKLLRHMKHYSSDITDSQWMLLQGILRDSRKREHSLGDIFNAIFYLLKNRLPMAYVARLFSKMGVSLLLFYQMEEHRCHRTNT